MGILLPVLAKMKKNAKAAVCQSNLKQLGIILSMYAGVNNDLTPSTSRRWPDTLRLMEQGNNNLLFCPLATKFTNDGGRHPYAAYLAFSFGPDYYYGYGSYGINAWICNPPSQIKTNAFGFATSNNWRRTDVSGAYDIPLFLDGMWIDSFPDANNIPPPYDGFQSIWNNPFVSKDSQMGVFCMGRHDKFTNGIFLDLSIRKVGLKELWKLKWHRNFNTNSPTPLWPAWMK
jgi:hypothetical protein